MRVLLFDNFQTSESRFTIGTPLPEIACSGSEADNAECYKCENGPDDVKIDHGDTLILCLDFLADHLTSVDGLDHGVHDFLPDGRAEC